MKVGHVLKDCPSSQKKVCYHCSRKGYHNRCLCPQKFPRQETDALLVTEPGQRGGFYECLVGLVKQGLRKEIGRKLLSWDKLITMITEVEALLMHAL